MSFLLGPIYAPPSGLSTSNTINTWASNVSITLNQILSSGHSDFGEFEANTSTVSITALSTEDDEYVPFFDFHYSSPFLDHEAGGTNHATKDSIYRIGSISKLFTVYALLLECGWKCWDDSISQYIPELHRAVSARPLNAIDEPDWGQITVGALASQLSGVGRDYANGDLSGQNFPWKESGLPELPAGDIPDCGVGNPGVPSCKRQEYFQGWTKRHPVFASQTTPVYSNAAYRILGYALEAMSGRPYDALMQSKVLTPLGLNNTSADLPPGKGSWVIPGGNKSGFHNYYGDEIPTSGIYSSSDNLARFGRSILLHKQISPVDTRRWMKPVTHTASLYVSVGSPWEIYRTRHQITEGRIIDIYTKSGSVGEYNAQLILIPDYGIALSILVAGSGAPINIAFEVVLQSLIPVLEEMTLDQACKQLCGTYESSQRDLNSSVTISTDAAGLYLSRWVNRGVDIEAVIQAYSAQTGNRPIKAIQLQATNLQESAGTSHIGQSARRVAYRALFDMTIEDPNGLPRIIDPNAGQWGSVDSNMYGEISVNDFVVHLGANGTAVMLEPRIVRDVLRRVR